MRTFHVTVVVAALLATATYSQSANPTVLRTHEIDHKIDTSTFTGTIESVDATKFTMVINGHEIIEHKHQKVVRRESVYTPPHQDQPKKKTEPPKNSKQTFKVDISCKITEPTKPVGLLSDFKEGDTVTITYTAVTGVDGTTSRVASELTLKKAK